MARNNIGVALIGVGRMGREHAPNLASMSNVRVVVVADAKLTAAMDMKQAARAERATDDIESALADPAVDAVMIVTPATTHADLIERAARHGKAIFCEKPVALDLARTRQALRVVEESGVPFQIGFQRRFDSGYARARSMIDAGAIGSIEMFRAVGKDPMPPPATYLPTSGGILVDTAIHDFDLARFLVGEVVEVHTWGAALIDPQFGEMGYADTTITTLRFESGALGSVENSWRAVYGYDVQTEIFGSRGKLHVYDVPKTPLWQYGENGVTSDHYFFFMDRFKDAYRLEVESFIRCLLDGKPPSPGPVDAIESLRIGLAATRSFREKRVVRLEEMV